VKSLRDQHKIKAKIKMKKFKSIILASTVCLWVFNGCGSSEEEVAPVASTEDESQEGLGADDSGSESSE
jgi:hypothetical protein